MAWQAGPFEAIRVVSDQMAYTGHHGLFFGIETLVCIQRGKYGVSVHVGLTCADLSGHKDEIKTEDAPQPAAERLPTANIQIYSY